MSKKFWISMFGNKWVFSGTIVLGIVPNIIYDFMKQNMLLGMILLLSLIMILFFLYRLERTIGDLHIDPGEHIPQTPHIISGLSFLNHSIDQEEEAGKASNIRVVLNLVEKHRPLLQKLHLVISKTSGVSASQTELYKWLQSQKLNPDEGNVSNSVEIEKDVKTD